MSVWNEDGSKSLTHDPDAGRPYGMSDTMAHFMAGMMQLSRELAIFIAPNVNSYKRYASLSWAPVNVVWGRDNRTTGSASSATATTSTSRTASRAAT
jgi:glutamine synthetase